MAIKVNNTTVIDDSRNISNIGIATITTNLNVGIGGTIITTTAGGLVGIGISSPTQALDVVGNINASGTITAQSDKRVKTNIQTIENALSKVLHLRGVEYNKIDNNERQIGVIAQEVEEIIPEVVYGTETKSVAYGNLIGLLIEAVKEQNQRIDELERRLEGN
jgi:hypothetical protein